MNCANCIKKEGTKWTTLLMFSDRMTEWQGETESSEWLEILKFRDRMTEWQGETEGGEEAESLIYMAEWV